MEQLDVIVIIKYFIRNQLWWCSWGLYVTALLVKLSHVMMSSWYLQALGQGPKLNEIFIIK